MTGRGWFQWRTWRQSLTSSLKIARLCAKTQGVTPPDRYPHKLPDRRRIPSAAAGVGPPTHRHSAGQRRGPHHRWAPGAHWDLRSSRVPGNGICGFRN
ncbi:hypothetical protein MAIT1_01146 [Magnetofaba australis IT-1]|uniref:Uncharacterized protein n=1 Tax=Magnetofaba australis IT-1 TaxID=1434232 RepID=A0A1Y2K797_9PROT|nr:hypothetical protein MAIT1_01146 [Magnetofaba australis IT-1]